MSSSLQISPVMMIYEVVNDSAERSSANGHSSSLLSETNSPSNATVKDAQASHLEEVKSAITSIVQTGDHGECRIESKPNIEAGQTMPVCEKGEERINQQLDSANATVVYSDTQQKLHQAIQQTLSDNKGDKQAQQPAKSTPPVLGEHRPVQGEATTSIPQVHSAGVKRKTRFFYWPPIENDDCDVSMI